MTGRIVWCIVWYGSTRLQNYKSPAKTTLPPASPKMKRKAPRCPGFGGMHAASSNVTSVAFQCVVLIWVFSPSLTTAWSTCAGCSFSRSNARQRRSMQLHRHEHSIANGAVTELSSDNTTVNRQSASAANTKTNRSKHTLHLISLPPTDDAFTKSGELLVRKCWKWKDSVLGDGRDYFIPRPRALKAFHALFVGMMIDITALAGIVDVTLTLPLPSSEGEQSDIRLTNVVSMHDSLFQSLAENSFLERFAIEECVVLSNCARLDILLVLKNIRETGTEAPTCSPSRPDISVADNLDSRKNTIEIADTAARYAVAYILHHQINVRRSKGATLLERTGLSSWLDLPGVIQPPTATSSITRDQSMHINQLSQRLISIADPQAISTHLCLVACGLAPRTNRPDREVIFRPYSSRDAREYQRRRTNARIHDRSVLLN